MKSFFPAALVMGPRKAGLQTSMTTEEAATEIGPGYSALVSGGKPSPVGAQLSGLWGDHSPLAKLTSPALQTISRHTAALSHPGNMAAATTVTVPSAAISSPRGGPGKMKSTSLSAAHPYLPRTLPLHRSGHRKAEGGYFCSSGHERSAARDIGSGGSTPLPRRHRTGKTTEPANMFAEGFQDCASEVLRFLREVECVEDSNPLLQGLQAHLSVVGRSICPEHIAQLDASDLQAWQTTLTSLPQSVAAAPTTQSRHEPSCTSDRVGAVTQAEARMLDLHPNTASTPLCSLSPVRATSRADRCSLSLSESSSSSSSSSGVESDVSMLSTSIQSDCDNADHIPEKTNSKDCPALPLLSSLTDCAESYKCSQSDTHTPADITTPTLSVPCSQHMQVGLSLPSDHVICSSASHVTTLVPPPLSRLSGQAIKMDTACHQARLLSKASPTPHQCKAASPPCDGSRGELFHLAPLDHSSPLPSSPHDSFFTSTTRDTPPTCATQSELHDRVTRTVLGSPTDTLSSAQTPHPPIPAQTQSQPSHTTIQSPTPALHTQNTSLAVNTADNAKDVIISQGNLNTLIVSSTLPTSNPNSIPQHTMNTLSTPDLPQRTMNTLSTRAMPQHTLSTPTLPSTPLDTDPAITWCQQPPHLSASSLSLLAIQPSLLQPFLPPSHVTPLTSDLLQPPAHVTPLPTPPMTSDLLQPPAHMTPTSAAPPLSPAPPTTSDLLQQVSSILELRPNFLPGVDSSSVASGSFADILLAVESCRSHGDARVRALAEELIYLIHNDGEDDDDGDEYDDENDDGDAGGDESGIEMDESPDWGNPSDLIEQ